MTYDPQKLKDKATAYCRLHRIGLRKELGHGLQGIVYATSRESAIKIHARQGSYLLEKNAYFRLEECNIRKIGKLIIPQLRGYDDENLILEMTRVSPPFLVDFGGAYLDELPDHASSASAAQTWENMEEEFGADWSEVRVVLDELSKYRIFLLDVNPRNVRLR